MNVSVSEFFEQLADRICLLGNQFNEMTSMASIPLQCAWVLLDLLLVVFLIRGIVKHRGWLIPAVMILPATVATVFQFVPYNIVNERYAEIAMTAALSLMAFLTVYKTGRYGKLNEYILCVFVILTIPFLIYLLRNPSNSTFPSVTDIRTMLIIVTFFLPIVLVWNLVNFIRRIRQRDCDMIIINSSILVGICYNVFFWFMIIKEYEKLMA